MFVINDIDRRIIKLLQSDGRITNRDLADKVALSPSPCLARRKRLEDRGVIRSYHASVDLSRVTPLVMVHTEVSLAQNTLATAKGIEEYIKNTQSIVYAVAVSGTVDYILVFAAPTLADYQLESDRMIEETGIEILTSHIVLNEVKRFEGYPIDSLLGKT